MQSKNSIRKLSWSEVITLIKRTFVEFFEENSFFHGAALSYYTVFSMVPMIYLALLSVGKILGQDKVLQMINQLLHEQVGLEDSSGIMNFLKDVNFEKGNFILNFIGIIVLLISSTALLSSLKTSINEFFDIKISIYDRKQRVAHSLLSRLSSIVMLPVFGIVILVMYVGQTVLISLGQTVFGELNNFEAFIMSSLEILITIGMNVVLFTIIFKYLHDGSVLWKLALAGGLVTGILLFLGQLLIKYYLKNHFFGSDAGVAGTLLVLLSWMYYSSQIIFLGAKFTKVYADLVGKSIAFYTRMKLKEEEKEALL